MLPLKAAAWDMVEGVFEMVKRKSSSGKEFHLHLVWMWQMGTSSSLLTKKGYMDFYLVLKRLPLTGDKKNDPVAATNKPANTEPSAQKTTDANTSSGNAVKKKTGTGRVKK